MNLAWPYSFYYKSATKNPSELNVKSQSSNETTNVNCSWNKQKQKYVHGSCDQGEGFSRKLKHNNNNSNPTQFRLVRKDNCLLNEIVWQRMNEEMLKLCAYYNFLSFQLRFTGPDNINKSSLFSHIHKLGMWWQPTNHSDSEWTKEYHFYCKNYRTRLENKRCVYIEPSTNHQCPLATSDFRLREW